VADDDPFDIEVLDLLTAYLSGEGTVGCGAHVLAGDLNFLVQKGFDCAEVHVDWGNNNFNFGGIEISHVEDVGDELFVRFNGTVTFPVTADDKFSLMSTWCAIILLDFTSLDQIYTFLNIILAAVILFDEVF